MICLPVDDPSWKQLFTFNVFLRSQLRFYLLQEGSAISRLALFDRQNSGDPREPHKEFKYSSSNILRLKTNRWDQLICLIQYVPEILSFQCKIVIKINEIFVHWLFDMHVKCADSTSRLAHRLLSSLMWLVAAILLWAVQTWASWALCGRGEDGVIPRLLLLPSPCQLFPESLPVVSSRFWVQVGFLCFWPLNRLDGWQVEGSTLTLVVAGQPVSVKTKEKWGLGTRAGRTLFFVFCLFNY